MCMYTSRTVDRARRGLLLVGARHRYVLAVLHSDRPHVQLEGRYVPRYSVMLACCEKTGCQGGVDGGPREVVYQAGRMHPMNRG